MPQQPLLVVHAIDRSTKEALRTEGFELLSVASLGRLTKTDFPRPPRLFVVYSLPGATAETRNAVLALRRERPLTEVIVWAPQAGGAAVRSLFKVGVYDVVVSRSAAALVGAVQEALKQQQILPRLNDLGRQRGRRSRFDAMLSRSDAMWDLFELCTRIAQADATVLISGETGTGKELLARAIHRRSNRSGRFVAANCASIHPELISSELFGHEKGAFTGADRAKKGLVMHANEGTLFLDEIGDMPPETQLSLLRMLQEKQIRPVGGLAEVPVDVRVVAATNVPLEAAVREGKFREDLFYRLDVIRVNVPPLRKRPEDILFLFGHFTKKLAQHYGLEPPTFTDGFLDALTNCAWPGNVRQLENLSERLVLSRPRRALTARDFESLSNASTTVADATDAEREAGSRGRVDTAQSLEDNLKPALEELEREYLQSLLKENAGRIEKSADQAGISRRTLLRKMNAYGLDKQDFKG